MHEIEELLSTYCPEAAPGGSLSSYLATIPLEAWEAETPVLDALIHETLRIAQPHTAMRRNLGPDTVIDSKIIPSGAYVVYPFSDVHLNPELYPDPWKFDPNRKEAKTPFGYVGWGGGECALQLHHYVVGGEADTVFSQVKPPALANAWQEWSSSLLLR